MKYLGEILTNDLKITQHLKEKKTTSNQSFMFVSTPLRNTFTNENKNINKTIPTNNTLVLLYGCEGSCINKEDIKELTDIQFIILRTRLY